jgi:sulfur carrier protein
VFPRFRDSVTGISGTDSGAIWYDPALRGVMTITLNGDTHELPGPVTVEALLRSLEIDSRRVAVEVNLTVVKKAAYETLVIGDRDEVEVVNFVGGG